MGVENAGEPEQLVFYVVNLSGSLGADQQRLPRHQFEGVDEIGFGRPAFGDRLLEDVQRGLADFA